MQRSRRSLLQRRADSEKTGTTGRKKLYYKVSLSLLLLSWGLILLNSLIRHGNGSKDILKNWFTIEDAGWCGDFACNDELSNEKDSVDGESHWHEALSGLHKVSRSAVILSPSDITSDQNVQKTPVFVGEVAQQKEDIFVGENNEATEHADEEAIDLDIKIEGGTPLKRDRSSRVAPSGLDEFKIRAVTAKEKSTSSQTGTVVHRVEPGGKEYNYASATKGAKVLEYNKEAKGASNILDRDKDKYLRNPCSAEEKYVVVELSEETLVDTIEIANFEHYSSNLKNFELLSSLVYPTDSWGKLGNFTAQNVKHAQRFNLPEPRWARYLKVNLISHYGTEFYCTLSVVEVFGVDVVEKMLEDLISVDEQHKEQMPVQEPTSGGELYKEPLKEIDNILTDEVPKTKKDATSRTVSEPVLETRQVGRMPGDTVLKILLQKVQSLDMNFSVLERYLEELNSRYAHIFKDFDNDMANKDILLDKIKLQMKELQGSKDIFTKDIGELLLWKSLVSSQLDTLARDNAKIRSDFERVRDSQLDKENRGLAVIFISFFFGCLAAVKLLVGLLLSIFRMRIPVEFCKMDSAWFFFLLSTSFIALILVL